MPSFAFLKQFVWNNIAFILPGICLITALAIGAHSWLAVASGTQMPTDPIAQHESVRASDAHRAEVLSITITPSGFHPAELTRPSDPFLLELNNKSGLDEVTVQAHRIQNNERSKVLNLNLVTTSSKKHKPLKLPPGRYELTEANHPDWSCSIVITAP